MRSIAAMVVCVPLMLAGGPGVAAPGATPRCESQSPINDALHVSCALTATDTTRHFRFTANFTGGHDDTVASMALTLDGALVSCENGSKTSLMGEDGDVGLHCRFSVAQRTQQVLQVLLKWSHARYVDFELVPE